MKKISVVFFLITSIISHPVESQEEIVAAIVNSQPYFLTSKKNCLSEIYIQSTTGGGNVNMECNPSDFTSSYLLLYTRFNYFFLNSKYLEAQPVLNDLKVLFESNDMYFPHSSYFDGMTSLIESLSRRGSVAKFIQSNNEFEIDVPELDTVFRLDTGALIGSIVSQRDLPTYKVPIIGFSGDSSPSEVTISDTKQLGRLPLLVGENNYLGLQSVLPFEKIRFKSTDADYHEYDFFIDGGNLIITTNITIEDEVYENVNICLDTGSEISLINGNKITLKNTENVDSKSIKFLSLLTASGPRQISVKGPFTTLLTSTDKKAKAFFTFVGYNNKSCHLVFGHDYLKNYLASIDFIKYKLILSKNRTSESPTSHE